MLKIGVLGAGHLGKIHINCIKQIENYELVGFYDQDLNTAKRVAEDAGVKNFADIDELIDAMEDKRLEADCEFLKNEEKRMQN